MMRAIHGIVVTDKMVEAGTYASDPYVECTVESLHYAERINKAIEAVLTSYGYRVIS